MVLYKASIIMILCSTNSILYIIMDQNKNLPCPISPVSHKTAFNYLDSSDLLFGTIIYWCLRMRHVESAKENDGDQDIKYVKLY